jgi:hypothetical protein
MPPPMLLPSLSHAIDSGKRLVIDWQQVDGTPRPRDLATIK